jgi:hypothetical protein
MAKMRSFSTVESNRNSSFSRHQILHRSLISKEYRFCKTLIFVVNQKEFQSPSLSCKLKSFHPGQWKHQKIIAFAPVKMINIHPMTLGRPAPKEI